MTSMSYICIICFFCAVFLPADSQIISARVGSTAILPCHWRNISVQMLHVQWSTVFETVFERKGVQIYEGEGYKTRVDVPQDNLLKGNCSLELKNVRLSDAGVYESYLSVKRIRRASTTKWILLQRIELSVDETPQESLQDISSARETSEESFYKRLIAGAGVKSNQPHIILISLLLCLCVLHF